MSDGITRVIKLEVVRSSTTREVRATWQELSDEVKRLHNRWLQRWEIEHVCNDSPAKLRAWMQQLRNWHQEDKKTRGPKPKCPVEFCSSEMRKAIYAGLPAEFAGLNSRVIQLALNRLTSTLGKKKSDGSAYPDWMRCLLNEIGRMSFTRGVPVPFDKANATIAMQDGEVCVTLRVDRIERDGKRGVSTPVTVRVIAGGKVARYAAPVRQLAEHNPDGLRGAMLLHDPNRGKWFVLFVVTMGKKEFPDTDPDKVCYVRASKRRPLRLRMCGRSQPATGDGYHVAMMRGNLIKQRRSRSQNYHIAGSSTKGHGLNRALKGFTKLSLRWRHFVKLNNATWASRIVERAAKAGCGSIVFFQPSNDQGRFLSEAGAIEGLETLNSWDWFQLKTLLADKADACGMGFFARKSGAKSQRADELVVSG